MEATEQASPSALEQIKANPEVFSGEIWAIALTELIEQNRDNVNFDLDKDLLTAWFSNAIMAGYDAGYKAAKAEIGEDGYNG